MTTVSDTDFWKNRRTFVTGCSGFLGSWLTAELVARGAEIVGLVRDQVPDSHFVRSGLVSKVTVVHGSLENGNLLRRALGEFEIESVFHIAAQAIVGVAYQNPVSTFEANIQGTWNVLEACRQTASVKRVVCASTDKAYGDHEDLPYSEGYALQGNHPYDVSKSCADLLATTYHKTYGLPVAITRCGNLFGPGDLNYNRIIPGTIRSVLKGEAPVIRSDGTLVRDYIYVRDAVGAYILLAEALDDPELHGEAFNFGTATPLSVLEMTQKLLQLMGREDLAPVILDEVKGEIKHQYLSSEKAKKLLSWTPVASLDDALKETIQWYRDLFAAESS